MLTRLPHDIIILISINLCPEDLLSLIQTCRGLHALAFNDYVWHHIYVEFPLDIYSMPDAPLSSLSGYEIKSSIVRALRLDQKWKKPVPKIGQIIKIDTKRPVKGIIPLGRDWLVVSSRIGHTLSLSLWHLDQSSTDAGANEFCAITLQPLRAYAFEAAFQGGTGKALIATVGSSNLGKCLLTIFQVNLTGLENDTGRGERSDYVLNQWNLEHPGIFGYTQISGPIIAAAVVHDSEFHSHEILLFNTDTEAAFKIDTPNIPNLASGRLLFKIYSNFIAIAGLYDKKIKLAVRELPSVIFSIPATRKAFSDKDIPLVSWASSIVDYETITTFRTQELFISFEPIYHSSLDIFPVIITVPPSNFLNENGRIDIFHFPVNTAKRNVKIDEWEPMYSLKTSPHVSLQPTCLGRTGYRAVWLSHQWNSDEYLLMKGCFPLSGDDPSVMPLLPPEMAWPFSPHECAALYLEECTGRVFVGIHTGEIFVLVLD